MVSGGRWQNCWDIVAIDVRGERWPGGQMQSHGRDGKESRRRW